MSTEARSVLGVWFVLMVSTAASAWWFSRDAVAPLVGNVAVMVIAAIKVWFVMTHFMELRGAPTAWRLAGIIWLVAAAGSVITIYLL